VERKRFELSTSALRTQDECVLSEDIKQLTSTPANGCTNGCTSSAEIAHAGQAEAANPADANRLELLAADAGLRAVVDGWSYLPEAVRVGIMAMVRAASGC
jgi:hypothetical protein